MATILHLLMCIFTSTTDGTYYVYTESDVCRVAEENRLSTSTMVINETPPEVISHGISVHISQNDNKKIMLSTIFLTIFT